MRLALDEMYSPQIAARLREHGHDAVHAREQRLDGRPDEDVLARNAVEGRATVANNAVDFVPIAKRLTADGIDHAGLILTSDRSLPRGRHGIGRMAAALERLLDANPAGEALQNQVLWLP